MEEENLRRFVAVLPFAVQGAATTIGALLLAFLGPDMTFLRLGSFGTFLFCLGNGICYFSTNIYVVTLFVGLVKGCGMVLVATSAQQIINSYFKESRATAMGICTLGTPMGGLVWPYITQYLLQNYGLKGTLLLSSGISCNCFIAVIYISSYAENQKRMISRKLNFNSFDKNGTARKNYDKVERNPQFSSINGKTVKKQCPKDKRIFSPFPKPRDSKNILGQLPNPLLLERNGSSNHLMKLTTFETTVPKKPSTDKECEMPPLLPKTKVLVHVFTSPIFYLLAATIIINLLLQNLICQVVVDYLSDKGIEKNLALVMISVYSCGGMTGRSALGWITDKGFMNTNAYVSLAMLISSSLIIVLTLTAQFSFLCASFFIIGLCQASTQSVTWSEYPLHFEEQEMLMATAFTRFIQGLCQLCSSAVTGYIRDLLGSYDYFIRLLGLTLFLTCVLRVCVFFHTWWLTRKYRKVETTDPEESAS